MRFGAETCKLYVTFKALYEGVNVYERTQVDTTLHRVDQAYKCVRHLPPIHVLQTHRGLNAVVYKG